jgi:hypothetical protein
MEWRWYASAFGTKPQWVEAAETADELEKTDMMEKADVVEMVEKAGAEMAEKGDAAVEKGDALETLASNLEA